MYSFNCPFCKIKQYDVYVKDGYLSDNPGDRSTFYYCNSCRKMLLESEIGRFERRIRRRRFLERIRGVFFCLLLISVLGCWLL